MSKPLSDATAPSDALSDEDRRLSPRSGLSVPCCLRADGRLRSAVGRTRNVSRSGALVQLPPGGPELASGDQVHVALVPPATGLVDAGELKPARVVRVIDSIRGTSCVALTWDLQTAPGLVEKALAASQSIEAA